MSSAKYPLIVQFHRDPQEGQPEGLMMSSLMWFNNAADRDAAARLPKTEATYDGLLYGADAIENDGETKDGLVIAAGIGFHPRTRELMGLSFRQDGLLTDRAGVAADLMFSGRQLVDAAHYRFQRNLVPCDDSEKQKLWQDPKVRRMVALAHDIHVSGNRTPNLALSVELAP